MAFANPDQVPLSTAAMQLRVSAEIVRRKILRGDLVGGKQGNRWWVYRTSLDEAVAAAQLPNPSLEKSV